MTRAIDIACFCSSDADARQIGREGEALLAARTFLIAGRKVTFENAGTLLARGETATAPAGWSPFEFELLLATCESAPPREVRLLVGGDAIEGKPEPLPTPAFPAGQVGFRFRLTSLQAAAFITGEPALEVEGEDTPIPPSVAEAARLDFPRELGVVLTLTEF